VLAASGRLASFFAISWIAPPFRQWIYTAILSRLDIWSDVSRSLPPYSFAKEGV